ncbi:MAG: hypothetical protein J7K98_02295, partial [Candidatus Aenigmarchaeota archaeon]|nr:hypothetical protein [Candidatus Aenigmarchaeota archaeon]
AYAMFEFDWYNSFTSLFSDGFKSPKKLEEFTLENLKDNIDRSLIFYFSKGNETDWFIPNKTGSLTFCFQGKCQSYQPIRISSLPSTTSFFFLDYSYSNGSVIPLLRKGSVGILSSTWKAFSLQSSKTLYWMSSCVQRPVGECLKKTKNLHLERYFMLKNHEFFNPNSYLNEFKSRLLYSLPFLKLDPSPEKATIFPEYDNGSFVIQKEISVNYTLIKTRNSTYLFVPNSDYETLNLSIPVVETIITLPTNSTIKSIKVSPVEVVEFNDTSTSYPDFSDSNFFVFNDSIFDGRKELRIVVIPVNRKNNTLYVWKRFLIKLIYSSSVEIISLSKTITSSGVLIKTNVVSEGNKDCTMFWKDEEDNIVQQQIHLNPGVNTIERNFKLNPGNHSISISLSCGHYIVGPKTLSVTIRKSKPSYQSFWTGIKYTFLGFVKSLYSSTTPSEKITVEVFNETTKVDYTGINYTLYYKQTPSRMEGVLKLADRKLKFNLNSTTETYELISHEGLCSIRKQLGSLEESCKGNAKRLKEIFNQTKAILTLKLKEVEEKVRTIKNR